MEKKRAMKRKKPESEDRCFICKAGGHLHFCHYRQCVKAYHTRCLMKKKLSIPSSESVWCCSRHTCSKCEGPSKFFCYCCPSALCTNCVDTTHFFLIARRYGLCHECRRRAILIENVEEVQPVGRINKLFKEYYDMVKENEGFSLKNLQSPEELSEFEQKQVICVHDSIENVEEEEDLQQRNMPLIGIEKYENEEVVCNMVGVVFASIVPENIKLVYLKRSLIQELLKEPESFQSKVKGSFVRVKSVSIGNQGINSFQLMEVTGASKASGGQDKDVMLQLSDMPDKICINMLSDENFSVEECENLNKRMEAGLLKKPTLDQLEEKARSLHKDMINHTLAREKKALESKIGYANEKGRRFFLFKLLEERKLLETPSHRLQLLSTPPKVIPELQESSFLLKDEERSSSTTVSLKQNCPHRAPFLINGTSNCAVQHQDTFTVEGASSPIDATNDSPVQLSSLSWKDTYDLGGPSSPIDVAPNCAVKPTDTYDHQGKSLSLGKNHQQTSISKTSINFEDMDEEQLDLLLIKPDVSFCSTDSGSWDEEEALKDIKDGLVLLLKQVPISNSKTMISVANGAFTSLHALQINYTSLYDCVRTYIRSSHLLACIEQFKEASSMEELAARYNLSKDYNETIQELMNQLSTDINKAMTVIQTKVSHMEKSLVKYKSEKPLMHKTQNDSAETTKRVLEKLKMLEDAVRNDIKTCVQSKEECYFEQIWESYVNAKAALLDL